MTLKQSSKDCKLSVRSIYPVEYFEVLGEKWLNIGTVAAASQYSAWPGAQRIGTWLWCPKQEEPIDMYSIYRVFLV